jgi:integrase
MVYMVKYEDLVPSLRTKFNAFLNVLAGGGPAIEGDSPVFLKGVTSKSLSQVTIDLRRTQIMQYVSALVVQGYPIDTLISVDAITTTKAITDAMDFFFHRAGDKMATQIQYIALAVRGLLHHHITGRLRHGIRVDKYRPASHSNQFSDPRIDLLDQIIREARPQERGLVAKNKKCLAMLDDPRNLGKLLHLPRRLLNEASKTGGKEGARLAEIALAIELLLMCPIRIGNLVGIDLARHIIKSSSGKKPVVRLSIPKGEVKNKREIEFEFPEHLARMLERHVNTYRPQLPGASSSWLFPSTEGGPRLYKLMARQISGIVRTHTGLIITPHQFRHLAGKMFLDGNPVGHETVRQVLGHASLDTTTQYYTGIDQVKAARIHDKAVLALRDSTKHIITKKRTKS